MKNNIRILQDYRDKSFITNILCQKSFDFFSKIKSIMSIPLLVSSSIMTVLNSSQINQNDMKIANIVLNGSTVLLLGFMNNFKISEKTVNYKTLANKFNKLTHHIEDKLNNENKDINKDDIRDIIKQYDDLYEQLEYSFPSHIKEKVKKLYLGERTLPNVLNCEINFLKTLSPNSSVDNYKQMASSYDLKNDTVVCPKIEGSVIFKNNISPRVLDVKKIEDLQVIDGLNYNI